MSKCIFVFLFTVFSRKETKKNKSRRHERRKTLNMSKNSNEKTKLESRKTSYFINYVEKFLSFFDHLSPYVDKKPNYPPLINENYLTN